ncbi:unnamed protein product [Prorocentrum cordatum]|uniref:Cytochrome c-553 n=1 Tax=Prorocentrum cordatum TaxID=2364126 RepID=A0ABN9VFG6_9DINO|nr:unnamed protein product [Polarella glacialis]CAK0870781.1 unnamed protein product [Polarella glacialis]
MSRCLCLLAAASLALYGASSFVTPASPPAAPQAASGAAATVREAVEEAAPASSSSASWSPLAIGAALGLVVAVMGGRPALAADLENGESVFLGNCAACHAGGNNSVVAEKTLRKAAIEQYLTGGYNAAAIKTQVTNGKGSMPAFGDKLGPDDIDDVAAYVLDQSTKW